MKKICCLCKNRYRGYGNSPAPFVKDPNARCCDDCNLEYIIPIRMNGGDYYPCKKNRIYYEDATGTFQIYNSIGEMIGSFTDMDRAVESCEVFGE